METLNQATQNDALSTQSVVPSKPVLTYNQKQKFAVLNSFYPDSATTTELVRLIEGKGENSFKKVIDKLTYIQQCDHKTALYQDALYDTFDLNKIYTFDEIMSNVSVVRMDNGLTPYTSRFKKNCEHDFVSLFIVTPEYEVSSYIDPLTGEPKTRTTHIGYTPLFKLKPED